VLAFLGGEFVLMPVLMRRGLQFLRALKSKNPWKSDHVLLRTCSSRNVGVLFASENISMLRY